MKETEEDRVLKKLKTRFKDHNFGFTDASWDQNDFFRRKVLMIDNRTTYIRWYDGMKDDIAYTLCKPIFPTPYTEYPLTKEIEDTAEKEVDDMLNMLVERFLSEK